MIGIIFAVIIGLYFMYAGFALLTLSIGFGSVHKSDYIYPIVLTAIGLCIECYVFFEAINISVNVNQ